MAGAFAGIVANENLLGLSEQALKESLPDVARVLKPSWGPRGVRGIFTLSSVNLHGQTFDVVFYFKDRRLARIEHRRIPPVDRCETDFTNLISTLNQEYGAGIGAADSTNAVDSRASAAWMGERFTAVVFKLTEKNRCELRVAFEPRLDKDASTL